MFHKGSARLVYVVVSVSAAIENNPRLYIDYTAPKISVEVGDRCKASAKSKVY